MNTECRATEELKQYEQKNNDDGYYPKDFHNIDFDLCEKHYRFTKTEYLKKLEVITLDEILNNDGNPHCIQAVNQMINDFNKYRDELVDFGESQSEIRNRMDESIVSIVSTYMMQDEHYMREAFEALI